MSLERLAAPALLCAITLAMLLALKPGPVNACTCVWDPNDQSRLRVIVDGADAIVVARVDKAPDFAQDQRALTNASTVLVAKGPVEDEFKLDTLSGSSCYYDANPGHHFLILRRLDDPTAHLTSSCSAFPVAYDEQTGAVSAVEPYHRALLASITNVAPLEQPPSSNSLLPATPSGSTMIALAVAAMGATVAGAQVVAYLRSRPRSADES